MSRLPLTLLVALALPLPAHALTLQPATLHITLIDDQSHPIPNAAVTFSQDATSSSALTTTTDPAGRATLTSPPSTLYWPASLTITAPGFSPLHRDLTLFTNADIDLPIRLLPARSTTLTLLTPDGHPAAHIPFNLFYYFTNENNVRSITNYTPDPDFITNDRGQYTLPHPPITGDFILSLGPRKLALHDAPQLSATLTARELQSLTTPASLHLTLLNPDHTPAANWLVADRPHFSDGVMSSNYGSSENLTVPHWLPLAPDATLTIPLPTRTLVLLSPEGVPLLFPLNPAAWPPGTHDVTLTLPPIQRTLTGRFVDAHDVPLPHIPISYNLSFSSGMHTISLASAISAAPTAQSVPHLESDAQGNFSIPLRFGAEHIGLSAGNSPNRESYHQDAHIGDVPIIHLTPVAPHNVVYPDPAHLKHVILQFLDADGQPVPADQIRYLADAATFVKSTPTRLNDVSFHDRRGLHVFVPADADAIRFHTDDGFFANTPMSFPLTSSDEQIIPVHLTNDQHLQPLSGTLLDASGAPVPDAYIGVGHADPYPNQGAARAWYSLSATTDSHGHFAFPAAPDSCVLIVERTDPRNDDPTIPPTPFTPVRPDHRDITITLPPTGRLQLLLPTAYPGSSSPFLYHITPATPAGPEVPSYRLAFETDPPSLIASALPAGDYHLDPSILPALANFKGLDLTIKPNERTTIDLRNAPMPETAITTLTITQDGKPLSGVQVAIFTAVDPAVAALPNPFDRRDIAPPFQPLTLDLTDSAGQVRFTAPMNQPCAALARLPGQSEGTLPFQLPSPTALILTLDPASPPPAPADSRFPPATEPFDRSVPNTPAELLTRILPLLHSDPLWTNATWITSP